jgi:Holliday junction DNA helicase RuvA
MIASVRGPVVAVAPDGAVVEVGGVGISVQCTPGTLARLRVGEPARLATSLVVREDSLTLYGFADDDERSLFELLQTASGVGPRLAQAVLAVLPPAEVRLAIAGGDIRALTRVPGIGRKGAERLIVELRDRIGSAAETGLPGGQPGTVAPVQPWRDQVRQALVGLGWSAREAEEAVEAVAAQAGDGADVPGLLRSALRLLGNQ